jgi:hypothetical protein
MLRWLRRELWETGCKVWIRDRSSLMYMEDGRLTTIAVKCSEKAFSFTSLPSLPGTTATANSFDQR